jgi:AcrR family transcriptional regulator
MGAALRLSADTGLAGLSLRSVAKAVGIVPTAFYRHFASIEELGIALVDEAFASLRQVLRDIRREMDVQRVIDDSVAILVRNVRERRSHFMFIARERVGGLSTVRETIRHELGLFERELAVDVARLPGVDSWDTEDVRVLSNLIVGAMVETAEAIITAPPERPDVERDIVRTAERQLRMVVIGAANWHSDTP